MSKYIPGNQKHLSLEDRKYIERSLNSGSSFKDIARFLCKDPTTISKEVKLHRVSDWYHKGTFFNAHNFCVHRYHCRKTNVCRKIILCNIKCTSCPTCNQTCPDFVKEQCNRLDKAPYVCTVSDLVVQRIGTDKRAVHVYQLTIQVVAFRRFQHEGSNVPLHPRGTLVIGIDDKHVLRLRSDAPQLQTRDYQDRKSVV